MITIEQQAHLEALARKAESGEDWAEICRLEAVCEAEEAMARCSYVHTTGDRCGRQEWHDGAHRID